MNHSIEEDEMEYEGMVIRPPSEADSILLQVTVGCSHNKCSFCGTYKEKRFRIKKDERILKDILFAARYCRRQDRVFLMDGDALIIPQKRLVWILERIREHLPWVRRIGLYANAKSIKMKTDEELRQLKELGLGIVYLGVETGHPELLKKICKGTSAENLIRQGKRIKAAGITALGHGAARHRRKGPVPGPRPGNRPAADRNGPRLCGRPDGHGVTEYRTGPGIRGRRLSAFGGAGIPVGVGGNGFSHSAFKRVVLFQPRFQLPAHQGPLS